MGVGAAMQTGFRQALEHGADIIVNIDADGQFDSADIPQLIAPILAGTAEFVTCSRFADSRLTPRMPEIKKWGNRWMTRIINIITGKKFTDVSCGFRAYTREAALRLVLFGRFTYTQETFIDLAFKGVSMTEVPLKVRGTREYGRSRVADNLWRYGLKSASIIFRSARDFRPFVFFGIPGLAITLVGLGCGSFLLWHWLSTGHTAPYRSLVQVAGIFIIVGVLLGFMAMLADMQHRNRILIEEIVYLTRKKFYERES
jgi:glycosyltransferase involved in cell wall biosynthesis